MQRRTTETVVTEEEIEQFEYTESDIKKLKDLISCEERFSLSPLIAHHLKEENDVVGEDYKFSQIVEDEAAILSRFESGKAKFHATVFILKIREELYKETSILLASAAVEAGATACSIEPNLEMLNMARSLMVKNLSVQSNILGESEEDHPVQALYTVLLLNNLALINCKVGNIPLGVELYKQAWLLGNKFFVSVEGIPFMDNIKSTLDNYAEGFASNPDSIVSYIVKRGVDKEDNIVLLIKSAIQKKILDKCISLSTSEQWDNKTLSYGLGSYLTEKNINKVLKKSLTEVSSDTVEEAQMLCFQQICVATTQTESPVCLDRFVDTYPEIAFKALIEHPEYCIDGWIVHRVGKKLSEGNFGFEEVPILVKTIDILLGESIGVPEETEDPIDKDIEAIGKMFSALEELG